MLLECMCFVTFNTPGLSDFGEFACNFSGRKCTSYIVRNPKNDKIPFLVEKLQVLLARSFPYVFEEKGMWARGFCLAVAPLHTQPCEGFKEFGNFLSPWHGWIISSNRKSVNFVAHMEEVHPYV